MTVVVKIGGKAAEDPRQRRELARQLSALQRARHRVVMVHGGGQMLTNTLDRLQIPTRFEHGLRVTDAATRDVALMVLAGIVNKQWVAEIESQKAAALGLCGGDGRLIEVRPLRTRSNGHAASLGYVGRPHKINVRVLEMAFDHGMIPVVSSLGLDAKCEYLNVNADDVAAAIAVALKADRLFYLTESGGVWDAEKRLLPLVKLGQIRGLIANGVVSDGMIPKLQSCARTLRHDVGEIDIVSAGPGVLLAAIRNKGHAGTRIVKSI
jgi:acetylglutamate kinase